MRVPLGLLTFFIALSHGTTNIRKTISNFSWPAGNSNLQPVVTQNIVFTSPTLYLLSYIGWSVCASSYLSFIATHLSHASRALCKISIFSIFPQCILLSAKTNINDLTTFIFVAWKWFQFGGIYKRVVWYRLYSISICDSTF